MPPGSTWPGRLPPPRPYAHSRPGANLMTASIDSHVGAGALARLVAKDEIRDLASRYALAVDDHDIRTVLAMFTNDGTFEVAGRTLRGHREIRAFYIDSMDRYH